MDSFLSDIHTGEKSYTLELYLTQVLDCVVTLSGASRLLFNFIRIFRENNTPNKNENPHPPIIS